jgi:hypothetical protein
MTRWAVFLTGVALLSSACDDATDPSPRIFQVLPAQAQVGTSIHILGEQFCGPDSKDVDDGGHCRVSVGLLVSLSGLEAFHPTKERENTFWDPGLVRTELPASAPAGATKLVVTVYGRQSNAVDFEVLE